MQSQFKLPFELPPQSSVLVAGAGGGFDVVCALPVAIALEAAGHQVHFGNYSFTDLAGLEGVERPLPGLVRVDASTEPPRGGYFPEGALARWWSANLHEAPVWCFGRVGVRPLSRAYAHLQERLGLDALLLLDGGVDGLFIGDEFDLATPSMDAVSILAAASLEGCEGIYAFTAFGTEGRANSVRHADALLRISELTRRGGLLGVAAATPGSEPGRRFLEALEAIHWDLPPLRQSIVASSIAAALEGRFGDCVLTPKTVDAPVWISALTLLYWFFDLEEVARAKPYRAEVLQTDTVSDVAEAIERVRQARGVRARSNLPI